MFRSERIKQILTIFFIVRICYLIFQIVASFLTGHSFSFVYTIMDSSNYIHVATYGYNEEKYYAFFPLIPLLIKFVSVYGVLIINSICVILSALLLYEIYNKETALFFLLSPIQIYCYIPYTEAIFIFLSIFAFYCYLNKKWLLMGISLGIGVCDRSIMAMLFFSLFIGMCIKWFRKEIKISNILKCYIPATIISCIYPIYLFVKTGNFLTFANVQYEYWDAIKSNLIKTILMDLKSFSIHDIYNKYLILLTIVSFILLCFAFYKTDIELKLYVLFTIFIIYSTCKDSYINANFPPSTSYFRYFLSCFPMYIGLANLKYKKIIKILFLILHIMIAGNFILSGWPF